MLYGTQTLVCLIFFSIKKEKLKNNLKIKPNVLYRKFRSRSSTTHKKIVNLKIRILSSYIFFKTIEIFFLYFVENFSKINFKNSKVKYYFNNIIYNLSYGYCTLRFLQDILHIYSEIRKWLILYSRKKSNDCMTNRSEIRWMNEWRKLSKKIIKKDHIDTTFNSSL